jgi:hypothetical protein
LIPEEDRVQEATIKNERFELQIALTNKDNQTVAIPEDLEIKHGDVFSKFTHRKTLINNFIQNMDMPEVAPLMRLADRPDIDEIITATQSILEHLKHDNPYYFTYRYGQSEGKAMEHGIRELYELARWAKDKELVLNVTPLRRFAVIRTGEEVVLDRPEEFAKW